MHSLLRRQELVRGVVVSIIALSFVIGLIWSVRHPRPNTNLLAIGAQGAVDRLTIPAVPPVELDGMTRQEVLLLRELAVNRYPELLDNAYRPDDGVFGQIEDGLPWWGTTGEYFFLFTRMNGEGANDGPSEEARVLLNPFFLVSAGIYYIEATDAQGNPWWWPGDHEALVRAQHPLALTYCEFATVTWEPHNARAEAVYDVGRCLDQMAQAHDATFNFRYASFSMPAYNARDFNLNYIYIDYDGAQNVSQHPSADCPPEAPPPCPPAPNTVFAIPHFLHRGGSCGLPSGCNNMSPSSPLDTVRLDGLPASIDLRLWTATPGSPDDPPTFVYTLRFE